MTDAVPTSLQFDPATLQTCRFLAGPTASGKSAAALALAERIGAEIVALDSMTLYRGMDIGTAKPSTAERERVPHHLIDLLDPHEEFTVAQYVVAAKAACREIIARGQVPLFVGGAGLYLRAVLRGVFDSPPADWDFRRRLEAEAAGAPADALHQRLARFDPAAARRLSPNDQRRIIRALEVYELTGKPASEQQQQSPLPPDLRPRQVYWLHPPRDWLYERINRRVESMIAAGLVDEVRGLLNGPPLGRTARQALGYREILDHLAGRMSLAEAIALIQTKSRQFAKRQHTWFRNLVECRAIPLTGAESPDDVASLIERAAQS